MGQDGRVDPSPEGFVLTFCLPFVDAASSAATGTGRMFKYR